MLAVRHAPPAPPQPIGSRARGLSEPGGTSPEPRVSQNGGVNAPAVDPSLVEFATDLVRRAGELTLGYFKSTELGLEMKQDGSPVTIADREAERLVRSEIAKRFPDDAILGEEEGDSEGRSGRRWIIDPIDGTKAFSHGVGLFTNLLALEDAHGPAVGVIGVPALGEIVAAGRGLGCRLNDRPTAVSTTATLQDAYLSTTGFDYWEPEMLMRARRSGMQMRTWGDGYGYVLVATGRIDAMVDAVIHPWDIAPCRVIIPEAGGRFTTIAGVQTSHQQDALATNGVIHDDVVAMLGTP